MLSEVPSWRNLLCILLSQNNKFLCCTRSHSQRNAFSIHPSIGISIGFVEIFYFAFEKFVLEIDRVLSEVLSWSFRSDCSTRSCPGTLWFPIRTPFVPLKTNTLSFWYYCFIGGVIGHKTVLISLRFWLDAVTYFVACVTFSWRGYARQCFYWKWPVGFVRYLADQIGDYEAGGGVALALLIRNWHPLLLYI